MPLIEIVSVCKQFGDHVVLDDMSLAVEQGETLAIMGRSGIGKSVTLLIITGLIPPDSGKVLLQGRDIASMSERELIPIRRKFSYVFQSGALFDSLTIRENVAFPLGECSNCHTGDIDGRVMQILERLGLEDTADLLPGEISTGMKKRVAIARALAAEPMAILYDEPTTGVDPITGKRISHLIREIQVELGVTSIVVTHDLKCARIASDRVAFIHEGRNSFTGDFSAFMASDMDELAKFKHSMPYMMRYLGESGA